MCSIFGIFNIQSDIKPLRQLAIKQSALMRHRGPDWSGVWNNDTAIMVHERLAIVDMEHGSQPLFSADGSVVLGVNGEIYNHKQLALDFPDYPFQTQSDCEVILTLYQQWKATEQKFNGQFIDRLQGMFAFALYDEADNSILIARDHLGIIPLYYGTDAKGQFYVSSEMKSLTAVCDEITEFPPGHFMYCKNDRTLNAKLIAPYYQRSWRDYETVTHNPLPLSMLAAAFETAVTEHLMSDVPYAVLLSGGLDSSLVSAIAQKHAAKRIEDNEQSPAWWPQLHSFAVGLEGSPDLIAAQKVADNIGTIHHSVHFTVQQGIDALSEVIYHLETYDVTTIRAATPMYLMARKIKAMGIKMVLSGEGADEIFGGYLYFHKAPDAKSFHEETVRKLDRLHQFDCLRANKAMAAWGVEARVPFLDKKFLDVAMSLDPELKRCGQSADNKMEKYILRDAFNGYLPDEILWRQKEQFSDGVGYSWIDGVKAFAEVEISDAEFAAASFNYPHNTPDTKEALLFRKIFEQHFPGEAALKCVPGGKSVACSTPEALLWSKDLQQTIDPSGRAVAEVHEDSY